MKRRSVSPLTGVAFDAAAVACHRTPSSTQFRLSFMAHTCYITVHRAFGAHKLLAELHGDLFSRHACPLEGAFFFVVVNETFVNVVKNDPKRRASPRSNYNDQHLLVERSKCSTTRISVGRKLPRQRKTETKQIASKRRRDTPKVDSTPGLASPTLAGPARLVGYISSLSKTNNPTPKGLSVQPGFH